MIKFKTLKHTADLKVRIYGNGPDEILLNSIATLAALFFKNKTNGNSFRKTIKLPDSINPSFIVSILNMLISDLETEGVLYYKGEKVSNSMLELNGYEPRKNVKKRNEIKAATFHNIPERFLGNYLDITFDV